jgi:hypothetical protein
MRWLFPLALVLILGGIIAAAHFLVMRGLARASVPVEEGESDDTDVRH